MPRFLTDKNPIHTGGGRKSEGKTAAFPFEREADGK
jgi:hypothetical protein